MLKYFKKSLTRCCFSSLSSSFDSIEETKATNDISLRIEKPLKIKMGNRIDFENSIFKNEEKLKAKQECIIS